MPTHNTLTKASAVMRLCKALHITAERLADCSQDDIVPRMFEAIKSAHPSLRLFIILCTPWVMLSLAMAKYSRITEGVSRMSKYLLGYISSSVVVPSTHPLFKPISSYMVEYGLGKGARSLVLHPPQGRSKFASRSERYYAMGMPDARKPKHTDEATKEPSLQYVPSVGFFSFRFNGHRMTFEKKETISKLTGIRDELTGAISRERDEMIVLSCLNLFGNTGPITEFLTYIQDATDKETEAMTKIFRAENPRGELMWDEGMARPARTLDAVTLDAHIKDPLLADITTYLSEKTRKFYISRNIPWRRGYLFFGPPGTGKTSFACAMAGHCGLNVYLLSMTHAGLTDSSLQSLFECLPSKCIVLLEDIDSAGIKREDMRASEVLDSAEEDFSDVWGPDPLNVPGHRKRFLRERTAGLSLSALLNVLDGVSAPEGRVVILTSNNPDSLDKALVRPGRIDRKVLFGYASKEVAQKLFVRIFGDSGLHDNVQSLADAFANKIPPGQITPAEVQGHLLQNMTDPVAAVKSADTFVAATLAEKQNDTVVAGFAAEVAPNAGPEGKGASKRAVVASKNFDHNVNAAPRDDLAQPQSHAAGSHSENDMGSLQAEVVAIPRRSSSEALEVEKTSSAEFPVDEEYKAQPLDAEDPIQSEMGSVVESGASRTGSGLSTPASELSEDGLAADSVATMDSCGPEYDSVHGADQYSICEDDLSDDSLYE